MKQYVKFVKDESETGELVQDIIHRKTGENLGRIYFNKKWKKYIVDFGDIYFDGACLDEISKQLHELDK